jgi:hypothetical protein
MAKMGRYCKAYSIQDFRKFSQWTEESENTRRETKEIDGKEIEVNRELTNEDFLYLQENYVVTDGVFQDENIIFDNVNSDWKDFCNNTLKFEIPVYEAVEVPTSAEPVKNEILN